MYTEAGRDASEGPTDAHVQVQANRALSLLYISGNVVNFTMKITINNKLNHLEH